MTVNLRDKRHDELEEDALPTRHAKHRKRRRCRNRSACSHGVFDKLLSLRNNDTASYQNGNVVSEQNEERVVIGASDPVQVTVYNICKPDTNDMITI